MTTNTSSSSSLLLLLVILRMLIRMRRRMDIPMRIVHTCLFSFSLFQQKRNLSLSLSVYSNTLLLPYGIYNILRSIYLYHATLLLKLVVVKCIRCPQGTRASSLEYQSDSTSTNLGGNNPTNLGGNNPTNLLSVVQPHHARSQVPEVCPKIIKCAVAGCEMLYLVLVHVIQMFKFQCSILC